MDWNNIKEWIVKAIGGVFIFLEIDINVVLILAYMMAIDTFWGVIKAALVRGIAFKTKILFIKFIGKISFLFIPLTLALMAKGVGIDFKIFVEAVIKLMILTEGISIITNFLSIKDNKNYKNGDFATQSIHFIRDYLIHFYMKIKSGFGRVERNILEEDKNKPEQEEDKNKPEQED